MKEVILHPENCCNKELLHRYLAAALSFPEWYGNNLDALHDCLTDTKEEISIIVPDVDALEEQLGPYARRLVRVLIAASSENPRIHLTAE